MFPPDCLTNPYTMLRPSPVPEPVGLVVKNGSNARRRTSSHMPDHGTRADFKGWTVMKKQSFVAQICNILSRHALLGVTMSAAKGEYKAAADRSARKKIVSPYTFCSKSPFENAYS